MSIIRNKIWKHITKKAEKIGLVVAPKPENEAGRLKELDRLNVVKKDLENDFRFSSLPRLASYLTECPQAAINIIGDDTQHCKVSHGRNSALTFMAKELPRGLSTCQHVLNNNLEPLVIEDVSIDERTKATYQASGKAMPKFYAGAPIVSTEGFVLGSFCVFDDEPKKIDHIKLDGLRLLADQFVQLLETLETGQSGIKNNDQNIEKLRGKYFSSATVLFSDFVGFTKLTEQLEPGELIELLSNYFNGFDQIMNRFGLKRIKTIGDSYMAVAGIPEQNTNHALLACKAAFEMINFTKGMGLQLASIGKEPWAIRLGVNTGSVIAGYNGKEFDIWGDSVNIASRMESSGLEGKVHISESTKNFVSNSVKLIKRDQINLKNKGDFDTYIVESLNLNL